VLMASTAAQYGRGATVTYWCGRTATFRLRILPLVQKILMNRAFIGPTRSKEVNIIDRRFLRLSGISILTSSVLVSTAASAADLPCVIRAIKWNDGGSDTTTNHVLFSTVALHSNGIAAFATGTLQNVECSAKPWGIGKAHCLHSDPAEALLSDRLSRNEGYDQPFNVRKPLSLQFMSIPTDSLGEMHVRQPNAVYDFHPACVGDLLTGNDQWGNHWTMSFQLSSRSKIR
jgi:hypothetical protein